MNTTTIRAILRAAIFTGTIGVLPQAALADDQSKPPGEETTESIPDHQEAEARGGGDTTLTREEATTRVPDHQEAEARGATDTTPIREPAGVPDHETAERRGADSNE